MLVIYETKAVEFLWVLVRCSVGVDVPGGELDDGALREMVAVAECMSARCHDFTATQRGANGVETLGFMDEALIRLGLWTLTCVWMGLPV